MEDFIFVLKPQRAYMDVFKEAMETLDHHNSLLLSEHGYNEEMKHLEQV